MGTESTTTQAPWMLLQVTPEEFWSKMRQLIREENEAKDKKEQAEKLVSPAEACKLFQPAISKVTLSKWAKEGKIQEHRIGGRIYFRQQDVLNSVQTLKKYQRGM